MNKEKIKTITNAIFYWKCRKCNKEIKTLNKEQMISLIGSHKKWCKK